MFWNKIAGLYDLFETFTTKRFTPAQERKSQNI